MAGITIGCLRTRAAASRHPRVVHEPRLWPDSFELQSELSRRDAPHLIQSALLEHQAAPARRHCLGRDRPHETPKCCQSDSELVGPSCSRGPEETRAEDERADGQSPRRPWATIRPCAFESSSRHPRSPLGTRQPLPRLGPVGTGPDRSDATRGTHAPSVAGRVQVVHRAEPQRCHRQDGPSRRVGTRRRYTSPCAEPSRGC